MTNEHTESTPAWIETSALTAPALLGASAGLLLGDLMHRSARRGIGVGLGILGVACLLPFAVGGVTRLITGPKSRVGVRRKIQRIRDMGMGAPESDEVDAELREQGLI
jgi:endonuclease YncB( thermonuclease family)